MKKPSVSVSCAVLVVFVSLVMGLGSADLAVASNKSNAANNSDSFAKRIAIAKKTWPPKAIKEHGVIIGKFEKMFRRYDDIAEVASNLRIQSAEEAMFDPEKQNHAYRQRFREELFKQITEQMANDGAEMPNRMDPAWPKFMEVMDSKIDEIMAGPKFRKMVQTTLEGVPTVGIYRSLMSSPALQEMFGGFILKALDSLVRKSDAAEALDALYASFEEEVALREQKFSKTYSPFGDEP